MRRPFSTIRDWLRARDRGYVASRRAARAAVLMPATFAVSDQVIGNPALATFSAFGSFAMLLLVDFSGPMRDRLANQATLAVACAAFVALATLASRTTWLAAAAMAVVAFCVLFAGAVSSVLAGASTALLLSFILPVSLPAPASAVPDRVAGWGLAAGVSLLAIRLLWPAPERNPIRAETIAACRALADRLRADLAYVTSRRTGADQDLHRAAIETSDRAVAALEAEFFATPYRPTGLATDARSVIRLIDELRWLDTIVHLTVPAGHQSASDPQVLAVKSSVADVLRCAADLLETPSAQGRIQLAGAADRMRDELAGLERTSVARLPGPEDRSARAMVSALDPTFRAQELSYVIGQVAANASLAAAAAERSWADRLLGRRPEGLPGTLSTARERASAYFSRDSLWLHNSLRGAAALGLAVLVADLSSVQHAFWVVFGTLAVLRSNALSTGQSIVRALAGTAIGFLVGGAIVYLVGTSTAVLWLLLPVAVLLAGLAPATISFAAGQAAFTLTLLILFNLLAPAGWKIGLLRVEDVAIGGAVSLAVGLLFWPRGAAAALGRALGEAYRASARYLADAVDYAVGRCDPDGGQAPPPRRQSRDAVAAARRLDDTFRGYLGEQGAKPASLSDVAGLVTGVAGVRLAADAVLDLWEADGAARGSRSAARRELQGTAADMVTWFDHFAGGLTGRETIPPPLSRDDAANDRLVDAVISDLRDAGGGATATGVRVLWTGDHLDAARRLQETLVARAQSALV